MQYHWEQTAAKQKERGHFKQRTTNRKRAILTVIGTTTGRFT